MKRLALALLIVVAFTSGALATVRWYGWQHARSAMGSGAPAAAHSSAIAVDIPPGEDWPSNALTPEQVMSAQPELLNAQLDRLAPRTPGKVNLYAIVFAGDGSENVFRNEADYFERLLSMRLGARGHVVALVNNPATLATQPLASWTNLEQSLDALASKMDPARDILLVYLTSHGGHDHSLLVDMDPLPLDQLRADDLRDIFARYPFKYKVIVVNACYSGGFIPPLQGPGSMIITAARSDRTSFGCGAESSFTWFGHAFLVEALNQTVNFQTAFRLARKQVAQWEKRDNYQASDPQIAVGAGIGAQLERWRAGFAPGPVIPFAPPPATSAHRAAQ